VNPDIGIVLRGMVDARALLAASGGEFNVLRRARRHGHPSVPALDLLCQLDHAGIALGVGHAAFALAFVSTLSRAPFNLTTVIALSNSATAPRI
jgi:hypothetical protein